MARSRYKKGDWNIRCDVCGFKFKSSEVKQRWDGLWVCRDDWEERHPSDFFRSRKEDTSVPFSRPDDTAAALSPYVEQEIGTLDSGLYVYEIYVDLE